MQQILFLCIRCQEALAGTYSVSEILGTAGMGKCDFCRKMRTCAKFEVSDKNTAGAGTPTA